MCGIFGVAGPRGSTLVDWALPQLAHRGPDSSGIWSDGQMALGHRRLAIIGVDDGGRQPMTSSSGRSVIVFNGEIYNYLELADRLAQEGRPVFRRYDTAVLLEALETWGVECLESLNGMFAFAWYRPAERRLVLGRDRWGKKPLFWGRVQLDDGSRVLAFSSELRPLVSLPGGPPAACALGVARYLVYDGMPSKETVYEGLEKLPAAEWLELGLDGTPLRKGRFYRFSARPRPCKPEEAEEAYLAALEDAVRLRLRSDVPVGLFLSGGLDSSLLAAVWRRVDPTGPIRTFTVGFEDPSFDERASARLVAEHVGAEHHEIVATGSALERELETVWMGLSEPFGDASIVPTSLLCRFAREYVTVALGGDGGDELQAGYDPFRAWKTAKALEKILPRKSWSYLARVVERLLPNDPGNMSLRFRVRHFGQGFLHERSERIQGWMASYTVPMALSVLHPELLEALDPEQILEPTRAAFSHARSASDLAAQQSTWIETYLECSILTKVDRASMLHSLEVRAPLLDPNVAAVCAVLPERLVFDSGRGKVLMRRVAERLLPRRTLEKPKKGFGVPQSLWLKTVLRSKLEESLAEKRQDAWYRTEIVRGLWEEHVRGHADHRKPLWNFLFSQPFRTAGSS